MRRYPLWLRLCAALSGAACTVLLMQTESKLSFLLTAALSLGLLLALFWRYPLLERMTETRRPGLCIVAAILALSAAYTAKSSFFSVCYGWLSRHLLPLPQGALLLRLTPWCVALAALPMLLCWMLWFLENMEKLGRRLWRESDFTERMFLLGAGLLFAMMIVFTYLCTQAFYGAHINGHWYNFDLIYSADSGYLLKTDVYRNVGAGQNDLRQPLFGLFAMPFAQTAWLISRLLFFLPECYVTVWQIMQTLIFLVGVVLLSRMMALRTPEKVIFLVMAAVCWPTLIFVLTAEQYLLAVFWLLLLLYLREPEEQSLSFVAATGSLLTSGIWFPLVTWDRNLRKFAKKTLLLCGLFFAVTTLCGRLTTFLDMPSYIRRYGYYAGADIDPVQKLMQYVNFVGACIAAPPSGPDLELTSHLSWQMLPVERWSIWGLTVLGMSIAGMLVSRRDRFSRICAVWMGFSLLLLGIVGWGAVDNGYMLYTLYFGWAYGSMCFRLIDRALDRVRPVKLVVLAILTVLLGIFNIYALRNVLIFGSQFYPALGGIA